MSEVLPTPERLALIEHRAWVRALARRLLADENDVDDVEQETWAVALTKPPTEPRATRWWLGVVASRFALQRLRGDARRSSREKASARPEAAGRPSAEVVAEADAHRHVVEAVFALPEPYRTTVLLRYFEGLEIAAVARRMEVPVETVRTRLRRAHERLRGDLEKEHGRPLAVFLAPSAGGAWSASHGASSAATAGTASSMAKAAVLAGAAVAVGVGGVRLMAALGDVAPPRGGGSVVAATPQDDGTGGGGRPAPATSDEPPPKPPADASQPAAPRTAADAWTAYDLADGKPLADFALRIRTAAGETEVRTDASGVVPARRADVLDVTPADVSWTFARPTQNAVKDERSLWFWRDRGVVGTLATSQTTRPPSVATAQFRWRFPHDASVKPDEPGAGLVWFHVHGLGGRADPAPTVRVGADGRLSGKAAAVRGAFLVVEADGFATAACPLTWRGEDDCVCSFDLRPTVRIVGRVFDASGKPVVGKTVELDSSVERAGAGDALALMALRTRGGYVWSGGAGKGVFTSIDTAETDVRGIFRFDVAAGGDAVASVFEPGCAVARKDLGKLTAAVAPFEMLLEPSNAQVVFLSAGAPLVSPTLTLQVADGRENGFNLATDAAGRADAGWLQRGRWYRLVPPDAGHSACFRWDGQATIEFERLPNEPTGDK